MCVCVLHEKKSTKSKQINYVKTCKTDLCINIHDIRKYQIAEKLGLGRESPENIMFRYFITPLMRLINKQCTSYIFEDSINLKIHIEHTIFHIFI